MKRESSDKNSRTLHRVWLISVIILGAVFVFCAVTYLTTPLFMVHPSYDRAAAGKLAAYDEITPVSVESGNNTLTGYLLDRPGTDNVIVFFGGISDDAAGIMLGFLEKDVYSDFAEEYDIVAADWPGYGTSEGRATADSLRSAAVDIADSFGGDSHSLVIMAYSMGTGPAVYAASKCDCDGLVLIAPYASSDDLYNSVVNIFHGPLRSLLSYHMDTDKYAAETAVLPLIAASQSDARIPYASSLRLAGCFPNGVCLETFDNISHGELPSDPGVVEAIGEYLEDIRH